MPYVEEYEDLALEIQSVPTGGESAAFARMGDGINYSSAIGWQSPEGNYYGQKRVVREYEVRIVWDGHNYWACDVPHAYVGKLSSLPERTDYFGIFYAVANGTDINQVNTSTGSYWPGPWDIYYFDVADQEWHKVDWRWKIRDHRAVPNPGVAKGVGHVVIFHNVTMLWDGYKWTRAHRHSTIVNDEPGIHVPDGFIEDYTAQLTDTHGRIVSVNDSLLEHAAANELSFDGVDSQIQSVQNDMLALDGSMDALNTVVSNMSSITYLTLAEANNLSAIYSQLVSESQNIIAWAETLNIVTEKNTYASSLAALGVALNPWLNNPPYPKQITENERDTILDCISAVETAKTALSKKIDDVSLGAIQYSINSRISEAVVEYKSKTNIGIFGSVVGSVGAIWCGGELLYADNSDDVTNNLPVLNYDNDTNSIIPVHIEPSTDYFIYIANYLSSQYNVASLPADGDKPSTPQHDFRGNLFLSQTPDYNGSLGSAAPGLHSRIVGKCKTDDTGYAEGGPFFVREINMSLIGRSVDLSQAFTEYSDFRVEFVDENTLAFNKFDGTFGLCYISGQLLQLGDGLELGRADYRITWSGGASPLTLDTSGIAASTLYNIYLANDSNEYNLNAISGTTGLPLVEGETGYDYRKDFRRRMFLSTKEHDARLLDEAYPGYYARHIGQVRTDANGYFKSSSDISLIRSATLNPTHLDGLAECVVQDVSTTEFKITRKKGTTGVVYVGGSPVQTYESTDSSVHTIRTSDALYNYTESNIDNPLSDSGVDVSAKPGIPIYLYLANGIDAWGGISTFCSLSAPESGYLSTNWPGNQARWIATLQLAPATVGSELVTNGAFTSDSSWTKGAGWAYSSPDQNMEHTPGSSASLSQSISIAANNLYACTFYITGRTAGIAAPKIGGTSGQSISGNTSSTQYLLATGTGALEIVPDTYFDGSVDNVSVKQVITGQFSGTYVKDSVGGVSAQIDDSIISTATTYSSNKIEQIRQQLLVKITMALGLNASHTAGLGLILEYVDASTIRLRSVSGDVEVIFPILEDVVTVTTTGITKTVSGSTNTLYYVYLVTDGSLAITTNAPTDVYSKISFYGDTHVLVGWLSFSATNTISGAHNVYSFWNEPSRTFLFNNSGGTGRLYYFDAFFNNPYTPVNLGSTGTITANLQGLLIPADKTATTRFGNFSDSFGVQKRMDGGTSFGWAYGSITTGDNIQGDATTVSSPGIWYGPNDYWEARVTRSFTRLINGTLTTGIYGSMNIYSCSASVRDYACNVYGGIYTETEQERLYPNPVFYWDFNNAGVVTIVRAGNI